MKQTLSSRIKAFSTNIALRKFYIGQIWNESGPPW